MMNGYSDGIAYDSEKLLKQLDSMDKEKKSAPKEIALRFSERQYEKLKSFDGLELKEVFVVYFGGVIRIFMWKIGSSQLIHGCFCPNEYF